MINSKLLTERVKSLEIKKDYFSTCDWTYNLAPIHDLVDVIRQGRCIHVHSSSFGFVSRKSKTWPSFFICARESFLWQSRVRRTKFEDSSFRTSWWKMFRSLPTLYDGSFSVPFFLNLGYHISEWNFRFSRTHSWIWYVSFYFSNTLITTTNTEPLLICTNIQELPTYQNLFT